MLLRQLKTFRGSSAVEQSAVNRLVAGSNPARGAFFQLKVGDLLKFKIKHQTLFGEKQPGRLFF